MTGDGVVDGADLDTLTSSWGGNNIAIDVDTNAVVGSDDLTWMLRHMNTSCEG